METDIYSYTHVTVEPYEERGRADRKIFGKNKSYCSTASVFIPTTQNLSQGCSKLGIFYTPFLSGHLY